MSGLQAKYLSEAALFNPAADAWAITRGFMTTQGISLALLGSGNLSELTDAAQARVNIGLQIGVDVQPHSSSLDRYAATAPSDLSLLLLSKATTAEWSLILNDLSTSGAVTSIAMSGGTTGLTVSGGPITSTGTFTLGGKLGVANGGTGVTTLGALKSVLGLNNVSNVALPNPVANKLIAWDSSGTGLVNLDIPSGGTVSGLITASGFTVNTGKLLGRSTTAVGNIEEIAISSGLALTGGILSATGILATATTAVAGRNALGLATVAATGAYSDLIGAPTPYTDEMAQDAVGLMIDTSLTYVDATPLLKVAEYITSFFVTATPSASAVLFLHVAAVPFTIAANFTNVLKVSVGTNPTASFALDVQKNGVSIGTITVSAAGAVTATTVGGVSKSVAAGDLLKIVGPGIADATAANMAFTIIGAR